MVDPLASISKSDIEEDTPHPGTLVISIMKWNSIIASSLAIPVTSTLIIEPFHESSGALRLISIDTDSLTSTPSTELPLAIHPSDESEPNGNICLLKSRDMSSIRFPVFVALIDMDLSSPGARSILLPLISSPS